MPGLVVLFTCGLPVGLSNADPQVITTAGGSDCFDQLLHLLDVVFYFVPLADRPRVRQLFLEFPDDLLQFLFDWPEGEFVYFLLRHGTLLLLSYPGPRASRRDQLRAFRRSLPDDFKARQASFLRLASPLTRGFIALFRLVRGEARVYLGTEPLKPRLGLQKHKLGMHAQIHHSPVSLDVCFFEGVQGFLFVPESRVNHRPVVGRDVFASPDALQLLQNLLCLRPLPGDCVGVGKIRLPGYIARRKRQGRPELVDGFRILLFFRIDLPEITVRRDETWIHLDRVLLRLLRAVVISAQVVDEPEICPDD